MTLWWLHVCYPGLSIKFEVGSWLGKNNRLYKQGVVPLNLGGGLGACSPRKFWNLEALKCHFQHSGHQICFSNFPSICLFSFPANPFNCSRKKKHTWIVCWPVRLAAETRLKSNESPWPNQLSAVTKESLLFLTTVDSECVIRPDLLIINLKLR